MMKYIYKDVAETLGYLPGAAAVGIPVAALVYALMKKRGQRRGEGPSFAAVVLFCVYLAAMVMITFLSRESGSRIGVDLELFSTWGINERNNAFVVENVLLFIPYGLLCSLLFPGVRRLWSGFLVGALTSLGIETLQLLTGRGYFQVDDILTNTLGTLIGLLLFRIFSGKGSEH